MMLSLINSPFSVPISPNPLGSSSFYSRVSLCVAFVSKKRIRTCKKSVTLFLGFDEVWRVRGQEVDVDKRWRCRIRVSDLDARIEAEILGFMEKSEKPSMFPTEEELRKGGRADLADAIRKRGGWLAFGWDEPVVDEIETSLGDDNGSDREDVFSSEETTDSGVVSSSNLSPLEVLEKSMEVGAAKESGVQGILGRLEKQRNRAFEISMEKNRNDALEKMELYGNGRSTHISSDFANVGEDGAYQKGTPSVSGSLNNTEPEGWRSWITQKAELQNFEAAEISYQKDQQENEEKSLHGSATLTNKDNVKADSMKDIDNHQIQVRLQHLEFEIKAILHTLRSKRVEYLSKQVSGRANNLEKLYDVWEFKENEFMTAQESLRSLRAKIAVLQGKMALAIIESRREVEEKQKRIDNAQGALKVLRTTSVVWTEKASEVLLVGSFDGWTTKRKMNKSEAGYFSLYLKLYPGRYEIKFIVDGVWRTDPLRPTVNGNGHENNLLIVT